MNNNQKRTVQMTNRRTVHSKRRKKQKNNLFKILMIGSIGVIIISSIILLARFIVKQNATKATISTEELSEEVKTSLLGTDEEPEVVMAGRPTPEVTPEPEPAPELDISDMTINQYGDYITLNSTAYEYYKFDLELADEFVDTLNDSISNIPTTVNIYNMIVPSSIDIMLPMSFLDEYSEKTSDQEKTIDYIYSKIDDSVTNIELYSILKSHADEDIYYDTDTRITSLGGYYIYEQWCYEMNFASTSLLDYSTATVSGFWGNTSSYVSNISSEKITYYIPSQNITMNDGQSIFKDLSGDSTSSKYKVFLGGSSSSVKHLSNADLSDGSCAIFVGDSTANTLAPYLAQNYQDLYFIDYRYFDDDIAELISEYSATDLIYCFNISATNTKELIEYID